MRKKVLLMVPMLHQGGFERVCVRTARMLQEHCDVSILLFSDADIGFDVSGLHIINIDVGSEKGKLRKIFNVWKRIRKVQRIKREMQVDITYSFGTSANMINVWTKGVGACWIGIRGFSDLSSKSIEFICERADKTICCSKMIQDKLKVKHPQKEIISIGNSYDIEEIQRLSEESLTKEEQAIFANHPVIISIGREDYLKGFWHLIRSFAIVQKKIPDSRLMIVGDGEYKEMKQFAVSMGIADKVIFTGRKKNPFRYARQASVYAMTSLSEGFPNALVEAMAVGLPVLTVNCASGPSEILADDYNTVADTTKVYHTEYGILTPAVRFEKQLDGNKPEPEEEVFAEELLALLEDKELREHYSEKGKERAKRYTDEVYLQALLSNM